MNKKFIILLTTLTLLLLGGAIFLWWSYSKAQSTNELAVSGDEVFGDPENNLTNTEINTNETINTNRNTTEEGNENKNGPTLADAIALSRSFTERFGTFSSQNNYENINNLRSYMTPKMEKTADDIIAKGKEKNGTGEQPYYGITTEALATTLLSSSAQKVNIIVTTQREESKEETNERKVFNQSAELMILAMSGLWKVDSIIWK